MLKTLLLLSSVIAGGLTTSTIHLTLAGSEQSEPVRQENEAQQSSNPVRVMSYNIRYNNPGDGINAWPNRKDQVAEMIGPRHEADIVGLQEATKVQIDDLQERLPDYEWVGVGRNDGNESGEFSPIFFRTDRFELLATNTFWLSEEPEMPGSTSWDTAITRVVTWARFIDLETDRSFYHFNTHFDHRGEQAREESAKLITRRIDEIAPDLPVVVTGDFNVNDQTRAYQIMVESGRLDDARFVSETEHQGPTTTFNNWEELRDPETRIDYIFVSDEVTVLNHRILDDRYDGYFPSDHLPVVSDITLQ